MPFRPEETTFSLEDAIESHFHATTTRSVLFAQLPDGTYGPVQVDANGKLEVVGLTGGGGGAADSVSIQDGVNPLFKVSVDSQGRISVANFPTTQQVSGTVAVNNFPATQPVSGTVTVANPTTNPETGLAKNATLTDGTQKTQVTNFPATQPVSLASVPTHGVTGPLTNTELRAAAVPVSGTVTVANPTANPETGLAKDATSQAIRDRLPSTLDADGGLKVHVQNQSGGSSGGLTNTELRASPVAVSGFPSVQPVSDNGGSLTVDGSVAVSNFPATQPVSGTVTVGNSSLAVTGPLTDAQLRGSAVPVSGTVGVSNFPATQPVSGTVGISGVVDVTPVTPAANDYLPVRLTDGAAFYSATGGSGGGATMLSTYSLETPFIAAGAAGAVVRPFAMFNPVAGTKIIRIREIWIMLGNVAPAAAAGILEWQALRIAAFTGGTALVATKLDTADPDSALTGVTALAHTALTITASTGTAAWSSRWSSINGTAIQMGNLPAQVIRMGETGNAKPLTIRPGQGFAVQCLTRIAAPNVMVGVEWTEE